MTNNTQELEQGAMGFNGACNGCRDDSNNGRQLQNRPHSCRSFPSHPPQEPECKNDACRCHSEHNYFQTESCCTGCHLVKKPEQKENCDCGGQHEGGGPEPLLPIYNPTPPPQEPEQKEKNCWRCKIGEPIEFHECAPFHTGKSLSDCGRSQYLVVPPDKKPQSQKGIDCDCSCEMCFDGISQTCKSDTKCHSWPEGHEKPQSQQLIEDRKDWREGLKFYKKFIENCIKNQLYQHGHKDFKGDYNPTVTISEEAEILLGSLEEFIAYIVDQQHNHSVRLCMEEIAKVKGVGSLVPLKDEISRSDVLEALQSLLQNNPNLK